MKNKLQRAMALCSIISIMACTSSCSKLIEIDPPITSVNGENVFNEDGAAIAVLTGIYSNMSASNVQNTAGWLTNVCFTTGLTGDELNLFYPNDQVFGLYAQNNISPAEITWMNLYQMIFVANSAIEQLPQGERLTPSVRNQLLGEAYFIRALNYFYLTNLYGDVPLAISTDVQKNRILPRSPVRKVYDLIIDDLNKAKENLNNNFIGKDGFSATTERVRPSRWAAIALLARVHLYLGNFVDAEQLSSEIINNNTLFTLEEIDNVFLKNSKEAIWQLQPVGDVASGTANTAEGRLFNLRSIPGGTNFFVVHLRDALVNSFEQNDQRRSKWINSFEVDGKFYYYPYKYKVGAESVLTKEYSAVLRVGEQYLIRAEARIRQNKIALGMQDLNELRKRASNREAPTDEQLNLLPVDLPLQQAILAVEHERQFELFTEWGHRWLDLKRTNRIDDVLTLVKPGYQSTDKLFPIPQSELSGNPNLIGHQNPGY